MSFAKIKIKELYFSMVNTKFGTKEVMINKLKQLKSKTQLKFYQIISDYYEEIKYRRQTGFFQPEEKPSAKSAQEIAKNFHGVLFSMKLLQTKSQG